MYPGMAKTAREEGFAEIADWFETLAKAEKSHAGRFQKLLDDRSAERPRPRRAGTGRPTPRTCPSPPMRTAHPERARHEHRGRASRTSRPTGSATTPRTRTTGTRTRSTGRSSASSRSATAAACASSTATASRPSSRSSTSEYDGDVRRLDAGATSSAVMDALLPVQAVRGAVPVHAARRARVPARLPQARAPLQGAARPARRGEPLRDRVLGDPDRAGARGARQPRPRQRDEPRRAAPLVPGEGARHPPRQAPARVRRARPSSAGPRRTGSMRASARRRGGALPDLLRAEQRARRSAATRSRCCERNGRSTCAACRGSRAAACRPGSTATSSALRDAGAGATSTSSCPTSRPARRCWRSTPPAR